MVTSISLVKYHLYLSFVIVELSLLPIFTYAGKGVPVAVFLFLIFSLATIISFVLVLRRKNELLRILHDKEAMKITLIAGLLNYLFPQFFLFMGTSVTDPVTASLIIRIWPVLYALMLPLFLKIKIHSWQIAGIILSFISVITVVTGGESLPGMEFSAGVL